MKRDIAGKKFGKLYVVKLHEHAKHGTSPKWLCKCECGKMTVVTSDHLVSGHTKSCGCSKRKYGKATQENHGLSRTPLYKVWQAMRDRVYNSNNRFFYRYGGRGITICEEWNSFLAFNEWANKNGYEKGLDIDRINNSLGYGPSNCRWVTHAVNLQNTHRRRTVKVNGVDTPLAELAKQCGTKYNYVYNQYKNGKSGDEIVQYYQRKRASA